MPRALGCKSPLHDNLYIIPSFCLRLLHEIRSWRGLHADEIWGLQDATIPDLGWIGTVGLGLRSAVIHIRACWSESTDFTFLYLPRNHHEPRVQLAFENCEAKKAIKKRKEKEKPSHYSYYFNQYLVHNVGWEEAGIASLVYYGWRNGGGSSHG